MRLDHELIRVLGAMGYDATAGSGDVVVLRHIVITCTTRLRPPAWWSDPEGTPLSSRSLRWLHDIIGHADVVALRVPERGAMSAQWRLWLRWQWRLMPLTPATMLTIFFTTAGAAGTDKRAP